MDCSARVSPARIRSHIKSVTHAPRWAPLLVDCPQPMRTGQGNARQSSCARVTEISRGLEVLSTTPAVG
ncbi:hypothetical protein [Streptomyces lancefieldiae]|uniref:Uncharacterized protein n=1 Tax=Streptomyces lancefieldiae TaxID=3075520 RepID=A0ABU3AYJ1_9ACTN|nr:hypothetical protein [Streptomyces sp. DSM 40712]MDT0615250.1 hypothetical protein [Streptomyces sp. DSM 40712]